MRIYGRGRDEELLGNVAVRLAGRNQCENFQLAGAELMLKTRGSRLIRVDQV